MLRRRGFTLVELLVVIAIIAILAAFLFPVLMSARDKARQAVSLSNAKQMGMSIKLYLSDYDECFPLGLGGLGPYWYWQLLYDVPAHWRLPETHLGIKMFASHWANSIQPYIKNHEVYHSPACPIKLYGGSNALYVNARSKPVPVSFTYNGLLHSLSFAQVARPSQLPLLWEGRGKASLTGFALSNPVLRCNYRSDGPCVYKSCIGLTSEEKQRSYPKSAMFNLDGTMWIHNKGAIFLSVDGNAKWRRLGAQISPDTTDWRVDPYMLYHEGGYPSHNWWDGCNSWFFRPDYEFDV